MAAVPKHIDIDDVIRRYRAGQTPVEIAATLPVSAATVRRRLAQRGELLTAAEATRAYFTRADALAQARAAQHLATTAHQRDDLDTAAIVAGYAAGASVRTLARQHGCSGPTVERVLRQAGVPLRDKAAAGLLRAAAEPPAAKAARIAAGAQARRGRPISQAGREAVAAGKQRNESQIIGVGEEQVLAALTAAGLQVARQVAVDRYNLDLAVGRLAVEVHRSRHGPHLDRFGRHRRVDKLTEAGWRVLYVWCPRGFSADDLHQVVAAVHRARRQPATPGQYTVLRCQGDYTPRSGGQAYQGTFVVTTGGGYHPPGGDRRVRGHA